MKRYEFLGYPVDSITTKEALTQIDNYIAENKPHRITPINASKLCMVDSNNRIADIISKSDMIIPEYAVVWGANKLKIRLAEHIGGIMLMRSILENAPKKNYSIYFLGAKQEVIGAMIRKIMDDYPSLKIAGHHHGYFTPKEDEKIIKDIRESKPDVLLVALGSPKQEIWVDDYFDELGIPVIMGVGGSFDVFSGLRKETPAFLRCGFEWLYRLAQDPTGLWKRYLTTNSKFLWKIAKEKLHFGNGNGNSNRAK